MLYQHTLMAPVRRLLCNVLMLASVAAPLLLNKVHSKLVAIAQAERVVAPTAAPTYVNGIGLVSRVSSGTTMKRDASDTDDTACSACVDVVSATAEGAEPADDDALPVPASASADQSHTEENEHTRLAQKATCGEAPYSSGTSSGDDEEDDSHDSVSRCGNAAGLREDRTAAAASSSGEACATQESKGSGFSTGNMRSTRDDGPSSSSSLSVKQGVTYAQYPWLLRFVNKHTEARYLALALSTNLQVRGSGVSCLWATYGLLMELLMVLLMELLRTHALLCLASQFPGVAAPSHQHRCAGSSISLQPLWPS